MAKVKEMLEFKRAVVDQLPTARRKTWQSRCGRYKVEEHAQRPGGLPTLYYALTVTDKLLAPWEILWTYKKKEQAVKACESHARKLARSV